MKQTPLPNGWLLSRNQTPAANGLTLTYWFSTDSGPALVEVKGQPYTGFVDAQFAPQLLDWLKPWPTSQWQLKPAQAMSFSNAPLQVLYCYSDKLWQQVQQYCQERGRPLLEADIRPCDRYLIERRIRGGAQWRRQPDGNYQLRAHDFHPTLSWVSLDIECSRDGELYSIGLYGDSDKRVVMRGQGQQCDWITWVDTEAELIQSLLAWFSQHDPDLILGWNVVGFDLKLLQKRAELNGIELRLGRGDTLPLWQQQAGPGRGFGLEGRLVLDGIDWLKAAFYQFESFALDNVANEILGEGKDCEDASNRMAEIEHNFHHNKLALAKYNLKDCELVWRIFEKLELIEFMMSRAQLTGLEADRLGGSVAAFVNLYLPELHRSGYVAPNLEQSDLAPSPGGYVMDSKPGRYQHILVLDFKSLYPSIIRSFLIDPMGMVAAQQAQDEDRVDGFRGAQFHRSQHHLPAIISTLWQQRELAKRSQNAPLSQAIKIIMNSFYGVLGAQGCRFHDPRLASSITLRGHEIMKLTRQWIEEQGYEVIYGDTDSTFVHVANAADSQGAREVGAQLAALINDKWQRKLSQEYGLDSVLELEFETHFEHFFMPTLRGAAQGSKKRYVGAKVAAAGEIQLIFKGMETVRSDWTPLAKQFQQRLYHAWFKGEPLTELIQEQVNLLLDGGCDELLLYKKRLRQPLEQYQSKGPHVIAAEKANAKLGRARYGRGSRIGYFMTLAGPQPQVACTAAIDYQHYLDKQLRPIIEPIVAHTEPPMDLEQLLNGQLGLF
ncbi:DNA polymerase II [Ferrimonas aestuarii]|uniref:DNA polymerase n=1 Tax=Ferrimonas aestuarii TaxID=2569539 RepID=A0A4U1BTQ7_9GAMM|nr:DNA polymerase II [Ferrimonas aestuarii]TKB58569.1 DNA polymerase II [Ferrimonas aestuarii]